MTGNSKSKKKIKLLIIIPSLQCGGSERYVTVLCNHIDKEKFDVTLVVLNNSDPFFIINEPAIKIIDLKVPRVLQSFFKIKKAVKSLKPDIIFTTANHLNLFFAIFKRTITGDIKIVGRESSIVSLQKKHEKFTWFFNVLLKKYYKRLDFIICQSAYMQKDLVEQYHVQKEKTIIINNPVELMDNKSLLPNKKETTNRIYKFVTVSRLSKVKGITRLINAVKHLKVPFIYHIIGEGAERPVLEQLIIDQGLSEKVILEGVKKQPYQNMEDADLFLMGSYHEGFPNALTEAGLLGIPVVAFDAPGGIKEIIRDGENGFLVKENDGVLFAETIQKALSANFNKSQISQQTSKRFSVTTIIQKVEQVFEEIYLA